MLVGADDGAVNVLRRPVQLTGRVALLLERGQHRVPDAGGSPAVEAGGHALPGAVALGQIAPLRAGGVDPEHGIDHLAVIAGGSAALWFLRWQQGCQPRPLGIREFMAVCHTRSLPSI
jgi:hypothetical protein